MTTSYENKFRLRGRRGTPWNRGAVAGLSAVDGIYGGEELIAIAQWRAAMPLWKRSLDIVGAALALIVLAPLFLLISLLVFLVSPGPVLFRQTRIGYRGQPFTCWKFRSMCRHPDDLAHRDHVDKLMHSHEPMDKMDDLNDERLIAYGRLFRATCLDELPQLFCVLAGTMSLVGPRPCLPYEFEAYRGEDMARLDAVPGLSGLWQVNGKNHTTFDEMVALDRRYVGEKSVSMDLKILMKTGPMILGQVADLVKGRLPTRGRAGS